MGIFFSCCIPAESDEKSFFDSHRKFRFGGKRNKKNRKFSLISNESKRKKKSCVEINKKIKKIYSSEPKTDQEKSLINEEKHKKFIKNNFLEVTDREQNRSTM